MDNEIDRKIDITAILFLLVQNRQQTHDWTLIGSGAIGLGIPRLIEGLLQYFEKNKNVLKFLICNQINLLFLYLCVKLKLEKLRIHKGRTSTVAIILPSISV